MTSNETGIPVPAEDAVSTRGPSTSLSAIISDETRDLYEHVFDVWLYLIFALLGVATNTVNMLVFSRQGLKDSTTICLFSIALWDFLSLVFGMCLRMYGVLELIRPAWGYSWYNIAWPYFINLQFLSSRAASDIASFVSFERCLCVMKPLKVKKIMPPRRTKQVVAIISLVILVTYSSGFYYFDVVWMHSPVFNTSVAQFVQRRLVFPGFDFRRYHDFISISFPTVSLVFMLICTLLIVARMRIISRQRKTLTARTEISPRDKRLVKMLLVILTIYVVHLIPKISVYYVRMAIPEFVVQGRYHNIHMACLYVGFFFESVNAAINFFVYITMSSRFRETLQELMPCSKLKVAR